ncbi:MAG TPA: NADH-quinone oxidoreductase subunit J [Bellilinea sp.]|jgi:NADH-quinone oxidoreductase subunit J|nr:NADH-quinone oxidoreductase subunit J [Bellilinea sp.]
MTPVQIIFLVTAALTLGAGLLVVTTRNMIHAALWLVVSLFGIAVLYVLLEAGFLAVVQVVVYIGAIAILMIFAIMLTRKIVNETTPRFNANWGWALLMGVVMFAGLAFILVSWPGINTPLAALPRSADPLRELGVALVSPDAYVLPFEVASIMLLAAMIGAIVVAWERK